MVDRTKLRAQLGGEEGVRTYPYTDSIGKLTIGIGHNLTKPLSAAAIEFLFNEDLDEAIAGLNVRLPWWLSLDEVRQRVLIDMTFNMGIEKVCKFTKTLQALYVRNFLLAADMMEDSLWAHEVGARSHILAQMMRSGKDQS